MQTEVDVYVFAYGSNMCTPRMRSRVPAAEPVTVGYVCQRQIIFHKRSDDGSAKADAAFSRNSADRVWGVVYRMYREHKYVLDRHEFLGIGYDREQVDVVVDAGAFRAWIYVARHEAIDTSLLPYSWYCELMIHGANEHQLPESYVDHLRSFESRIDPDSNRHEIHRRLIDEEYPR